jgi:uncharacterized membrane protein
MSQSEFQNENAGFQRNTPPKPRINPIKKLGKLRETVMGFLYLIVAIALIWATKTGYTEVFEPTIAYGLAVVFIIYGLFRLYRALIKKD